MRTGTPDDVGVLLAYARKVVIIPGYGLAVAQAQHTVRELADALSARGVETFFAIHPVAGRMPGHMNVLLAEANVPYDELKEMDEANPEMSTADVALVVGANDTVNPAAKSTPGSPIYGMPIIHADEAENIIFLKRSMRPGFAGIDNDLLYDPKTTMLFGDAKDTLRSWWPRSTTPDPASGAVLDRGEPAVVGVVESARPRAPRGRADRVCRRAVLVEGAHDVAVAVQGARHRLFAEVAQQLDPAQEHGRSRVDVHGRLERGELGLGAEKADPPQGGRRQAGQERPPSIRRPRWRRARGRGRDAGRAQTSGCRLTQGATPVTAAARRTRARWRAEASGPTRTVRPGSGR